MSGTPPEPPLRRGRLRRAPRYGAFITTGAVAGVLVAVVLSLVGAATDYGRPAVLGYLAVVLGLAGALLGALVAVLAGIRADRRR